MADKPPMRCKAPPERQKHKWHWLTKKGKKNPVIATMLGGRWWMPAELYDQHTPEQARAAGWRYVGPAIPPATGGDGAG